MGNVNYKKVFAIKKENEKKIPEAMSYAEDMIKESGLENISFEN